MFALEVEYLLGRSFAGQFRDRSASEWPPHPGRLFSALASAYFENGSNTKERQALEWLERQRPPLIRAGDPGDANRVQAFVPTNYIGDGPPVSRGKQPRYFPAQAPSDAVVHFVWTEALPSSEVAFALDQLASRVGYLGKACSVIRMRSTESPQEPNYMPDHGGDHVLRIPSSGRLAELELLFATNRQPSGGMQQRYRRSDQQQIEEPTQSEFGQMVVLRKLVGPGLPIEASLTLTDAIRRALMSNAGALGPINELIHGHQGSTHCAIAAIPFVESEYADGHLMGFAIILPRTARPSDRRAVLSAAASLSENGLSIPGVGAWTLEPVDATVPNQGLRSTTWSHPARRWRSVSPILLDRFPKKNGPTVDEILMASCRRIGLPAPVRIEHGPYSKVKGVPPAPAFRMRRAGDERPRWGVHALLEFVQPVQGPVLLGAGRYFGLGLMRPQWEERNDTD